MLVVSIIVRRAGPADLLTLELDLPYARLALATNVIRDLDELKYVLLIARQYAANLKSPEGART